MRFLYVCKQYLRLFFALVLAVTFALAVRMANVCKLSALQGERTFYLYSASSQCAQTSRLALSDIPFVRGESVRLQGQYVVERGDEIAQNIARAYGAKLLFVEYLPAGNCYYLYAPQLGAGARMGDAVVNLHIAVTGGGCTVGTPLIFGGF